jgi:Tfp pilus assembly PilM family ATPase
MASSSTIPPAATNPSSVTPAPTNHKRRGLEPPLRRVLAVDAGSRCIRLLLLESRFGKFRVVRQDALDLQEEGLVSAEELKAHLQATIAEWGRPPLALVLPQPIAVSQIVDLPPVPDPEARQLIEAETRKLGGVSESVMVYDFARVPLFAEHRQSFWVTFCQEGEIESRISRLGLEHQEFREITTTANALLTAWHAARTAQRDVVLVHAGAQNTTVVAIHQGVAVSASSFPMAGDFFTRAIARLARLSPSESERLKRSNNLLTGEQTLAGFAEVVEGWAAELKQQLSEWRRQSSGPAEIITTGGAFEQPGLRDYLARHAGFNLQPWPASDAPDRLQTAQGFEIALGAALQALGQGSQSASLLPASRRAAWKRHLGRQRLEFANALLLAACCVALALGVWQKLSLIQRKQALANKVQAGLGVVQTNSALTRVLLSGYDELRPLLECQQTTLDTLQSLARLQAARSNRTLWYVLIADQQSYFSHPPALAPTNAISAGMTDTELAFRRRDPTNASPARPGMIAELCVPESAGAARSTLSLVVGSLKESPMFARVDLLPEDLRRSLADPQVIITNRHFALALDFATTEFQATATTKSRSRPPERGPAPPGGYP